jgi:hypothetical protein
MAEISEDVMAERIAMRHLIDAIRRGEYDIDFELQKGSTMNLHEQAQTGKPEIINPDPKLIEIAEKVIEQNNRILAMNESLLLKLTSPIVWVPGETGQVKYEAPQYCAQCNENTIPEACVRDMAYASCKKKAGGE